MSSIKSGYLSFNRLSVSILALCGLLLSSCSDTSLNGSMQANKPPKTYLTVSEVNRSGSDRLSSQINISWWGDDPDGYIKGYELALNNDTTEGNWHFTQSTDSVFILPIPNGKDTADVVFRVRAIDNEDLRDPIGAKVIFPIKNTPPEVQFIPTELPPDTSFSVFNFGWNLNDVDGFANINRIELQLNRSGNWIVIPPEENLITININDDSGADATGAAFYGLSYRSSSLTFNGFKINDDNELIIRAVDNAGALSPQDTVQWFIKRQQSKILVLHDYATINANSVRDLHLNSLREAGITNYDLITINDGELLAGSKINLSAALPRIVNPTLSKLISKWKYIYFFSSDLNRNITYLEEMSSEFRANGGKIFANVQMANLATNDALFSFLPMSSFASLPDSVDTNGDGKYDRISIATNFRLPRNRFAYASNANWDSLRINVTKSGIAPMNPSSGAKVLYSAQFQFQEPGFPSAKNFEFPGAGVICLENAEKSMIYFSLDFNDIVIDGLNHLGPLVKNLCVDELGFPTN